ncbi:MAG: selenide, water dikinase SelD [Oscillospiraceae bacterium]|nr:selenide, water dikinase SelD [Oscillospiraceae bacterium]
MPEIKLTRLSGSAGCAAKLGPGALSEIVRGLPKQHDENLLIGFDLCDDACVYKINDELVIVKTVDFFPPVVDDAYTYGQIAAANALSDVYAMGASPCLALNLLCIPGKLAGDVAQDILKGGLNKASEAGAVIAGGHTIDDNEPKYGLCVTGIAKPHEIWTNKSAVPGDVLILTKPLGTGISITARKLDKLSDDELLPAIESMKTLNKYARDEAVAVGVNACTDVTGFSLLGHAHEMAFASGVTLEISAEGPALLPHVLELAQEGVIPQGAYRNRKYLEEKMILDTAAPRYLTDILFDPQTSGGLLFSLPENKAGKLMERLGKITPHARVVGRVLAFCDVHVKVV